MSFVNRLKKVTISFCCVFAVLGGTVAAFNAGGGNSFNAFAEETALIADVSSLTDYPAEFVKYVSEGFENISDFAVNGEVFAFSEGNTVSVILNGKERTDYKTDSKVTSLDCDETGEFFYKNGSGAVFTLKENKPAEHNFRELDLEGVYAGNFNYYKDAHGDNYVINKADGSAPKKLEGFSNVKKYGESVYALKDGKFFKFNGFDAEDAGVKISYTDLSSVKNVRFGDTVQSLKTLNKDSLHYVALNGGENAYVTEIDLNLISDNPDDVFLPAVKTFKIGAADGPAEGKEAMLLAVSGDTYVVSADGVCYIMNKANAGEPFERAFSQVPENTSMRVAIDKACAYSSPFVCTGTKLYDMPKNAQVKVLGKVEHLNLFVIEYSSENDGTVKGFVPYGYLSAYNAPVENDPPATTDPGYSEESPAKTVVLIIAVIALILIALGYLTYVATSSKQKDKKKKGSKNNDSSLPPQNG